MLNEPVEVLTGQVATATGQSGTFNTSGPHLDLEIVVTAVSGTSPSCTFSVQFSEDGTDWAAPASNSFTAITAAGNAAMQFTALAPYWRLVWTITGTSPSFTFNVYQYDL